MSTACELKCRTINDSRGGGGVMHYKLFRDTLVPLSYQCAINYISESRENVGDVI